MEYSDGILKHPNEYDDSIPAGSISEFVLGHAEKYGEDAACVDANTKRTYSYLQIVRITKQLAGGLKVKMGLTTGQNVAIVLPNCLEYPLTTLAVNLCGGVAMLINPAHNVAELQHVIHITSPAFWVTTADFLSKYPQLYPDSDPSSKVVIHGERVDGFLSWDDIVEAGTGVELPPSSIDQQQTALILFSSGTTGVPKGVALTNLNMMAGRRQNLELTKYVPRDPSERSLAILPFFHVFGISTAFDYLVRGLFFVLIPKFTFTTFLEAIQEYKVTVVSLVPAIAVPMCKYPVEQQYDLSSIRYIFSGAAALSKEVADRLAEKLSCFIFQGYGMTESTMRTHSNFFGNSRDGSIGVVMPFCESKIVDPDTDRALGPNQVGEICVRGPLIMKGYVGNEKATSSIIDSQGWLHSGDVGYYDEDGFFFITDRMKELIKYKGFQVSPTELEQIILTCDQVIDAAVVSVPDEMAGELPRAFVVKNPDSAITEAQIVQFVAERVSGYKKLRGGVVFVDSIPKTSTGKILRRQLQNPTSKL